jgi:hypothetical protein
VVAQFYFCILLFVCQNLATGVDILLFYLQKTIPMLSLQYALTKDDYINFYTYNMWDAPGQKKAKLFYYAKQIVVNVGIIALVFLSGIFQIRPIYFYAYVIILLLSTAMQVYSARNGVMKKAEKITEDEDNEALFLETKMLIAESGISIKDELKEQHFQWQAFIRKEENESYCYLFTNSMEALIIPKRVLKTNQDKEQFEKLLTLHLSFDAEIKHLLKS